MVKEIEDIEKPAIKAAKQLGWSGLKVIFDGTRSAPDRLFGRNGRHVLIEFKKPGKSPSDQQLIRHRQLREEYGIPVFWTDSVAGCLRILTRITNSQGCYLTIKPSDIETNYKG